MTHLRSLLTTALLFLAGCREAASVPVEPKWQVTSIHELAGEINRRTEIHLMGISDLTLEEKEVAFPRAGGLWEDAKELLSAFEQVLHLHDLNLSSLGVGRPYKINPALRS